VRVELDVVGSGSCHMTGFHINDAGTSGSATRVFV
jgi:hypothetical protein